MEIVEYEALAPRKVRGTDIKQGDKLYAIRTDVNGIDMYFVWSYVHRDIAEKVAKQLEPGPKDALDAAANWRSSRARLLPTAKRF